jgi:hypothetical protein
MDYKYFMGEKILDISGEEFKDIKDLKEMILAGVRATQKFVITTLPNVLVLNTKQYRALQPDPMLQSMRMAEKQVYVTPQNVMEVRVNES